MNLIDFHITEIINEEYDKIYKLYGITEEELGVIKNKSEKWWIEHLFHDGCLQKYKYWDDGGYNIGEQVFDLNRNDKPYYVGYVGQH